MAQINEQKLNRPPVINLPISALQKSCCGCAGWQLHPSTTSSMPAPSKKSTQSPRRTLCSWDMAMMTLTTPALDEHSANTSGSVKSHRKGNRVGSQQRREGGEAEVAGWALLSRKTAVDRNPFISFKYTSEFKLEQITEEEEWLPPPLSFPPSLWMTHRETYNSWIQSHSGLECWEGRTQGASYVLNNSGTASSNAGKKKNYHPLPPLVPASDVLFPHRPPLGVFMQFVVKESDSFVKYELWHILTQAKLFKALRQISG